MVQGPHCDTKIMGGWLMKFWAKKHCPAPPSNCAPFRRQICKNRTFPCTFPQLTYPSARSMKISQKHGQLTLVFTKNIKSLTPRPLQSKAGTKSTANADFQGTLSPWLLAEEHNWDCSPLQIACFYLGIFPSCHVHLGTIPTKHAKYYPSHRL